MERIQQAVEKARRQRDGSIGRKLSTLEQHHSADEHKVIANDAHLDSEPEPQDNNIQALKQQSADSNPNRGAVSVEYTQTRRLSFSEQDLKARRIVAGFAHDPRSEPYRQLRSQVLKKMRSNQWQTLAITSPTPNSGKSITALNLAISLSQEVNQTVMLVDLDLRNPGIARALGINNDKGVMDYVFGDEPLEEILFNPGYDRMVILPGTPQGHLTSEILTSPEMSSLQQELRNRYEDRIIIYDLPALLTSDDALVFTPNADATLLIIEDGGSNETQLERSIALLQGTQLIGTVINKLK